MAVSGTMALSIHQSIPISLQDIVLIAASVGAAYTDYKYRKIYDKMNYSLMLFGLILAFAALNVNGLKEAGFGIFIGFAIYVIPCELGAIGGGDAKFMMAVGALQGYVFMIAATLFGFIFGGVQSFILIARKEKGIVTFFKSLTSGSIFTTSYEDRTSEENVPLGVYFALANIITLILRYYGIFLSNN